MIRCAGNKYYFCDSNDHFINEYPNKNYDYYIYQCPFCEKEFETEQHLSNHDKFCQDKKNCCFRCYNKGHWTSECYTKKNKFGYFIND